MNTLDWSVLRDFLAVAETGSFSKAAERLRTSQPTLSRRIAALEESLNMRLFVRTPRGLLLTDEGETVLEGARRVEQAALAIERSADGAQDTLTGTVRVSLTEGLGTVWLPEKLAAFHARHGQLCVELLIDNRAVDLVRREADIAVRLFRPQQPDLVAKHVADISMGLYASRAYLERAGEPASVKDLKAHRLVAFDERMLARNPAVQRLESLFSPENIVHRSNSFSGQLAATRAGIGLGVHDCFMADAAPDLVRLMPREFNHTMEIWLVTHPDVRRSARIRAVYDFLAENFQKDRDRLAGTASAAAAAARRGRAAA